MCLINGLRLLCDEQIETLLDDQSLPAVRVLRGESGGMGGSSGQIVRRAFLEEGKQQRGQSVGVSGCRITNMARINIT